MLPLAITMMAGPQIMSAIILTTTTRAVRVSVGFLAGVLLAVIVGIAITRTLFHLLGSNVSLGKESDNSSVGKIIQYVLVALLVLLILRNYLTRATSEPPKWLEGLMHADPRKAFKTGFLIILLMPSDVMVMLTVGANLEQNHEGFGSAAVFILATILIASLPLLGLLLLGRRAERAMPAVRDWMDTHSWLVNIFCCLIFIVLILA